MPWSKHGWIWFDSMTDEQAQQGGVWVMGDAPYSDVLDYPGRNDGSFLVKSWVATPEKYGKDKYPFKDRRQENRIEYVWVLSGSLYERRNQYSSKNEIRPMEEVSIQPEEERSWELPADRRLAAGITLLSRLPLTHEPDGIRAGKDMAVAVWDFYFEPELCKRLLNRWPRGRYSDYPWQYVELFAGEATVRAGSCRPDKAVLRPGDRVFVKNSMAEWKLAVGSRGVCIYLGEFIDPARMIV